MILEAFTKEELVEVRSSLHHLIEALDRIPGSQGMREEYWAHIYREAKKIPGIVSLSNLQLNDIIYDGKGIESKLYKRANPFKDYGKTLLQASATRKIFFDPNEGAEISKHRILSQWAEALVKFQERVGTSDIRWGNLLWSPDLTKMVYWEESIEVPVPEEFTAEWVATSGKTREGAALLISKAGEPSYKVTMPQKGIKLRKFFKVPTPEEGSYEFVIQRQRTFEGIR